MTIAVGRAKFEIDWRELPSRAGSMGSPEGSARATFTPRERNFQAEGDRIFRVLAEDVAMRQLQQLGPGSGNTKIVRYGGNEAHLRFFAGRWPNSSERKRRARTRRCPLH
jgi:hypothetical protein